jgi:hypothetical protein
VKAAVPAMMLWAKRDNKKIACPLAHTLTIPYVMYLGRGAFVPKMFA